MDQFYNLVQDHPSILIFTYWLPFIICFFLIKFYYNCYHFIESHKITYRPFTLSLSIYGLTMYILIFFSFLVGITLSYISILSH